MSASNATQSDSPAQSTFGPAVASYTAKAAPWLAELILLEEKETGARNNFFRLIDYGFTIPLKESFLAFKSTQSAAISSVKTGLNTAHSEASQMSGKSLGDVVELQRQLDAGLERVKVIQDDLADFEVQAESHANVESPYGGPEMWDDPERAAAAHLKSFSW